MTEPIQSPIVFVVEQQAHDYSSAIEYGTLQFMETRRLASTAPNVPETWNDRVTKFLRQQLMAYVPERDYIIPTGSPMKLMLVGLLLAEKGPRHRLLGWDSRNNKYLEYHISIERSTHGD